MRQPGHICASHGGAAQAHFAHVMHGPLTHLDRFLIKRFEGLPHWHKGCGEAIHCLCDGVLVLVVRHSGEDDDEPNPTEEGERDEGLERGVCLLYTSPSPRDRTRSRMPSSA